MASFVAHSLSSKPPSIQGCGGGCGDNGCAVTAERELACVGLGLFFFVDRSRYQDCGIGELGWLGGIGSEVTLRCFVGLMFGFLVYIEGAACLLYLERGGKGRRDEHRGCCDTFHFEKGFWWAYVSVYWIETVI
jgi:hypothetical protein